MVRSSQQSDWFSSSSALLMLFRAAWARPRFRRYLDWRMKTNFSVITVKLELRPDCRLMKSCKFSPPEIFILAAVLELVLNRLLPPALYIIYYHEVYHLFLSIINWQAREAKLTSNMYQWCLPASSQYSIQYSVLNRIQSLSADELVIGETPISFYSLFFHVLKHL